MAKVTLSYNPYLMETSIKFNDRDPYANSIVERYTKSKLQDWIDDAPKIIGEEMNGYDFDLEYYGTELDYEELKASFQKANVSEESVPMFHKKVLQSRKEKTKEINDVLHWLETENNNNFDNNTFRSSNTDIFDESYTFYTVNMQDAEMVFLKEYNISVENVDSTAELENKVEINTTPIFIYVDDEYYHLLPDELSNLIRNGIKPKQIFFLIDKDVSKAMAKRVIQDIGIAEPQIISMEDDTKVREYFYAYPVTDRINQAIQVFNLAIKDIKKVVDADSAIIGAADLSITKEVDSIDAKINSLKKAKEALQGREKLEMPAGIKEARKLLMNELNEWKKIKLKFSPDYAAKYADNYDNLIKQSVGKFAKITQEQFVDKQNRELKKYQTIYKKSSKDGFNADIDSKEVKLKTQVSLKKDLLALKKEKYVEQKPELMDMLLGSDKPKKKIKIIVYDADKWRKYVLSVLLPDVDDYIQKRYEQIVNTADKAAVRYIDHIDELINELQREKNDSLHNLSNDQLALQKDKDWLSKFEEYVNEIERA